MQTAEDILSVLENWAAQKRPISPDEYINAAMKLNSLTSYEDDKLTVLEQIVAQMRVKFLDEGMTATASRMRTEASNEFVQARHQRAKNARIQQTIMLAKQRARMASEEMRNQ